MLSVGNMNGRLPLKYNNEDLPMKNVSDVKLKVFRKCNERKPFLPEVLSWASAKTRDILYWNLGLNLCKKA